MPDALREITTVRLDLRPLAPDDAAALQKMTDDPAITGLIPFLPTPFTLADATALVAGAGAQPGTFFGAWERATGDLVAIVGTHRQGDEIEIGHWVGIACQGRGLATEAAGAVVAALRGVDPSARLVADCRPAHLASWHLLEKLGFRADGRDGHRPGRKRLVWAPP